jgi:hypothetical protein
MFKRQKIMAELQIQPNSGLPAQMSDNWVRNVLNRMIQNSDQQVSETGAKLKDHFNNRHC